MPPKAAKDGTKISTARGEVLRFKSPAEFVRSHIRFRRPHHHHQGAPTSRRRARAAVLGEQEHRRL